MSTTETILLGAGQLGGHLPWPPARVYVPGPPAVGSAGGARPAPGTPLCGQFVVTIPGAPWGPTEDGVLNPRSIFFMDELDNVFKEHGEAEARRILRVYRDMGANHVTTGPSFAAGYGNDYPFTNWLADPQAYRDFHELLLDEGFEFTHFAFTDNPPYYTVGAKRFDWERVRRDFGPVFEALAPITRRVHYMWEDYQRSDHMAVGFRMLREYFSDALIGWENPVEPATHLCPGTSDEEEPHCWNVATDAGCGMLGVECVAVDREDQIEIIDGAAFGMEDRRRSLMEQNVYDIKDMVRRGSNHYADFPNFTVEALENAAWSIYRRRLSPRIGRTWHRTLSSIPGVVHILDALPNAE